MGGNVAGEGRGLCSLIWGEHGKDAGECGEIQENADRIISSLCSTVLVDPSASRKALAPAVGFGSSAPGDCGDGGGGALREGGGAA